MAGEGDGMRSDRPLWPAPSLPVHPLLLALLPHISAALLMSLGYQASCAGVLPEVDEVLWYQMGR